MRVGRCLSYSLSDSHCLVQDRSFLIQFLQKTYHLFPQRWVRVNCLTTWLGREGRSKEQKPRFLITSQMDLQIVSLILSLFSTLASPGITFFQYLSLFWPNSGKITCILASASPVRGTEDGYSPVLLSYHSSNLLGLQMPLLLYIVFLVVLDKFQEKRI